MINIQDVFKLNGRVHKEDGPAWIDYFEDGSISEEAYYIDGKMHREDGPAHIEYHRGGSVKYLFYYINGIRVDWNKGAI